MSTLSDATTVHFSRGIPPLEAIPSEELADHTAFVLEERRDEVFQYAPIGKYRGDPALREQLGAFHGVDPERIFVGNGSLQVLDLVAAHLLRDGGDVLVERPTYDRAVGIVERHGGRLLSVPLEADGIDVELLRERLPDRPAPAFLYTIPDFQNPSGVTTSTEKRRALVELAAEHDFPILEDVPYRELRYHGEAPPSLGELAQDARVITLGSLSKVLSPGLRIGYAISDPSTATALAALAEGTYLSPAPLCQAVAARCLAAGAVGAHIERVRDFLRPRHDAAVSAAREQLGDALLAVPDGGYYLAAHLRVDADEPALLAAARADGVVLTPGSAFYPRGASPPQGTLFVRLPFQALEPEEFASGVERLARVAESLSR